MSLPGIHVLCNETITTAITTPREYTAITGLEGMTSCTIEAVFSGTGGTTVTALVRSRMGSAGTWREIASIDFVAAGAKGATIVTKEGALAAFATLSANSVLNWLGSELSVSASSTGTWASGSLVVRAHCA